MASVPNLQQPEGAAGGKGAHVLHTPLLPSLEASD